MTILKSDGSETPKEIERKFLVKSLPENLDHYPHQKILQGYVEISDDGREVRVRQKGGKYYRTEKRGSGKTRLELESEISSEQFEESWKEVGGRIIEKTRFDIFQRGGLFELDIYHGKLEGLVVVEREFISEEESNVFVPPEWVGKEVTDDKRYKNQNLARYGCPEETISK